MEENINAIKNHEHHEHSECCKHEHHHHEHGECCEHEHHEHGEHCEHKPEPHNSKWDIEFDLVGLECPNCTAKIDDRVAHSQLVENSYLDYVSKHLRIKIAGGKTLEQVKTEVERIVHELEPEVEVKEIEKSQKNTTQEYSVFEKHKLDIIQISIAVVLLAVSFFLPSLPKAILAIISYIIAGRKVVVQAFKNILKGQAMDEMFLMTVATFGAFCLKDFDEAAAVMVFFQVGELFQNIAVERSRKSISKLLELAPEQVSVKLADGTIKKMNTKEVEIGQTVVVSAGEKIGLDGVVINGESEVNNSALTGEFMPVKIQKNSEVLSGAINGSGVFEMQVTKEYADSTVAQILELVEQANSQKANTEKFITRFAKVYTPIVVVLALIVGLIVPIFAGDFAKWIYKALMFLVISCPCALVISVPLSFFAGIGGASKMGVLVKGAKDIENMAKAGICAFDKTGTLTEGKFAVCEIINNNNKKQVLETACIAESLSTHPLGRSICAEYEKKYGKPNQIGENIKEIAGGGVSCVINGEQVLCGKYEFLKQNGIQVEEVPQNGACVYVAKNNKYLGAIILNDKIKDSSKQAITELNQMGLQTVLLTGDKKSQALSVAESLNISDCYYQLLPAQKAERLGELKKNGICMFTGDGINDAPVIATADVGFAMGCGGSDAAIETADAVVMTDNPMGIVNAIKISKKTMGIAYQNIIGALAVKIIIMLLGVMGIAGMWLAIFADVGVAVLAILNSLRAGNIKE